jgi:hypothetical protein
MIKVLICREDGFDLCTDGFDLHEESVTSQRYRPYLPLVRAVFVC